ncbi:MAG: hypothetical protein ACRDBX_01895, partial [Erysipelotrichaceae bacterium]
FNQPVHFTTEGPIALLSPESVSFLGGCASTYIKTCGQAGRARVHIHCASHTFTQEFEVEVDRMIKE